MGLGEAELGQFCHEVDHGERCKITCPKYDVEITPAGITMFVHADVYQHFMLDQYNLPWRFMLEWGDIISTVSAEKHNV